MKITIKNKTGFLLKRNKFDKKIKVDLFPHFKDKEFDNNDYILGFIISNLNSFINFINITNRKLRLKKTNHIHYSLLINKLTKTELQFLDEKTDEIINKYNLGENWRLSLQTAVFTKVLFIPPANGVYISESKLNYNMKLRSMNSVKMLQTRLLDATKYPAIYITKDMTPSKIMSWIEDNYTFVTRAITKSNLKKQIKSKIKDETLLVGHFAWLLKNDGFSWTKIQKYFEENEFINNEKEFVVTADDIRLAYKSYAKTLSYFE